MRARPWPDSVSKTLTVKERSRLTMAAVSRLPVIWRSSAIAFRMSPRRVLVSYTLRKPSVARHKVIDLAKESTTPSRRCSSVISVVSSAEPK